MGLKHYCLILPKFYDLLSILTVAADCIRT